MKRKKKILFLTPRDSSKYLGGVEKHVHLLTQELIKKGYKVAEFSLSHIVPNQNLLKQYAIAHRFNRKVSYKILAWQYLWRRRKEIESTDIIHIHDVFWCFFPIYIYFSVKYCLMNLVKYHAAARSITKWKRKKPKFYITFHGWEGKYPPSKSAVWQKKLAQKLCAGSIGVGNFYQKWYGIKPNLTTWGVLDNNFIQRSKLTAISKQIKKVSVFGRLDQVNGIETILKAADYFKKDGYEFLFIGDGEKRQEAEKLGKVTGMIETPRQFLEKTDLAIASSYLSILEAISLAKPVVAVAANPLKMTYLISHPLVKYISIARSVPELIQMVKKIKKLDISAQNWALSQTPDKLADLYLKLWKIK